VSEGITQLQDWSGRIYHKLAANLQNWAPDLFSYQPVLAATLRPLQARYGPTIMATLGRLWQQSLDEAATELGETQLWSAWEELSHLLGRSWRGSMLAECVNSLLRPVLHGRKHTNQGCLELFRFSHNVRPFARGKRTNHSPAQLVGLHIPDDPLILLGLKPKVSI
jgi:hypothetical protein